MLVELFAKSNYGSFNIKLAHLFGLERSIYLNELIDIQFKVLDDKIDNDGFFSISRDIMEYRTLIPPTNQIEMDAYFTELKVMEISEKDDSLVKINLDVLSSLLLEGNEKLIEKIAKKYAKRNRKTAISKALKERVSDIKDEALRNAFCTWIDDIINAKKIITNATVDNFRADLEFEIGEDYEYGVEILEVARSLGYTNFGYALRAYSLNPRYQSSIKRRKSKYKEEEDKQELLEDVDTDRMVLGDHGLVSLNKEELEYCQKIKDSKGRPIWKELIKRLDKYNYEHPGRTYGPGVRGIKEQIKSFGYPRHDPNLYK